MTGRAEEEEQALSLRKIFADRYPYGPWNIMKSPLLLGIERQGIILRQSMEMPVIPGCFDSVKHLKVDESRQQLYSVHESVYTSGLHWVDGSSSLVQKDAAILLAPSQLNSRNGKGFMYLSLGHTKRVEDARSGMCCRDERRVGYSIVPYQPSGMEFCKDVAMQTMHDVLRESRYVISEKHGTGEGYSDVIFVADVMRNLDRSKPSEVKNHGRDKTYNLVDSCTIMFFEKCFAWIGVRVKMDEQRNDVMEGCIWQVICL